MKRICPKCQSEKDPSEFPLAVGACRDCFDPETLASLTSLIARGPATKPRRETGRPDTLPHGTKFCPSCRQTKLKTEFHSARGNGFEKAGHPSSFCKPCNLAARVLHRLTTRSYMSREDNVVFRKELRDQFRKSGIASYPDMLEAYRAGSSKVPEGTPDTYVPKLEPIA